MPALPPRSRASSRGRSNCSKPRIARPELAGARTKEAGPLRPRPYFWKGDGTVVLETAAYRSLAGVGIVLPAPYLIWQKTHEDETFDPLSKFRPLPESMAAFVALGFVRLKRDRRRRPSETGIPDVPPGARTADCSHCSGLHPGQFGGRICRQFCRCSLSAI